MFTDILASDWILSRPLTEKNTIADTCSNDTEYLWKFSQEPSDIMGVTNRSLLFIKAKKANPTISKSFMLSKCLREDQVLRGEQKGRGKNLPFLLQLSMYGL